jgi:Xaa-Pro aminopeptidase
MERLKKACRELAQDGLDFALVTSHENVAYLSGLCTPLPVTYPTEMPLGFPLSLVLVDVRQEDAVLVAVDGLRDLAQRQCLLKHVELLPPGAELDRPPKATGYLEGLRKAFAARGAGGKKGRIGVEVKSLPVLISSWLSESRDQPLADATPALERSRRTKTADEVQLLERVARVGDAAQTALVSASRDHGQNELDVWSDVLKAVYREAGEIVPVYGELVTGPRTNEVHYPGGPRDRVIARGDTGIMDISMRLNGYWSDNCNTVVFGADPNLEQKRHMRAAMECYNAAREVLRPGIRCSELSEAIERVQARHGVHPPRYYGHQIGVTVNEHPKLIPTDTTIIEAGMVFCVEPGAYAGAAGDCGARFEKAMLVTETGPRVLHQFRWGM